MRPAVALFAALLITGAISARAQDATPTPVPPSPIDDETIVVTAHGHAEAISSGVVLEYIIRVPGDDAASAEKKFSKKLKSLVRGMEEEAPVTTLIVVDSHWAPRFQANGFVFQSQFGQNPPFRGEQGATFTGRFFVGVHGLQEVGRAVMQKRLAQVLSKLGDNELTGAEDDVDILMAHMEADTESLMKQSERDAMNKARGRASALARLANRKLGKASLLHESYSFCDNDQVKWGSNYFGFVFPMTGDRWSASLTVSCDTELNVSFALD